MQFFNPVETQFGHGVRKGLIKDCNNKNTLIFCTKSALKRYSSDKIISLLLTNKNINFEHNFSSNPSIEEIENICKKNKNNNFEIIIGLGGGSAMDAAKIASVAIPAYQLELSILDLIDNTQLLKNIKKILCILVPTTAGTGSEVTPFATIWDYKNNKKKSLSDKSMYAEKAYIDPDFLIGIPLQIAISTGLDALNQAFESIWNKNSNKKSRAFARQSALLSLKSLPEIHMIDKNKDLRKNIAHSSFLAGLAISHTRTSICHSISYPLTLRHGIDHGLACAFSMLEVYKFNKDFIKEDIEYLTNFLKEDPYIALQNIYKKHQIEKMISELLPKESEFFVSIEDFITEGRFENNIKHCQDDDLISIITNSYYRLRSY